MATPIVPQTKICTHCHIEKPLSEFHERTQAKDGHFADCKLCYNLKRIGYKATFRDVAGHQGEQLVVAKLRSMGIYAAPGKCSEWRRIDVVAWGCVRIEVKYAAIKRGRHFHFNLGKNSLSADIMVLVCDYAERMTFHVFNCTDPLFYIDGRNKAGLTYTPNITRAVGSVNSLTDDVMESALDQWSLIDDHLARVSREIMVQYPLQ